MANNETIADIVAKKRRLAAEMEKALGDQHSSVEMLKDDADRIEAAYKREREASGNTAALHEALETALKTIRGVINSTISPRSNTVFDCRDKLSAALAAPPRNCDVYNSESCRMAYHLHGDGLMTMQAFADWLYAPATEKEGGAK